MAVFYGRGTRQPWKNDAGCSVSSKNQASSFGTLTGVIGMGAEPICDVKDRFSLVRVVSNKLDIEDAVDAANAQLKRR